MAKKMGLLILFIATFGCLAGFAQAADEKPQAAVTLTYANFPPASTFPCVQMERWKTEVEKRTAGKIAVQTFPGESLLSAKEMLDGVINGQADIGCLCMAYQPGRFPVTNVTALPLDISSSKIGSQVLWGLYSKYKPAEFAKVKVLTMFTTAPANIMSKKPIRTLADLKGLDLRASGIAVDILKAWGANPVGMPMSSTPEALQKGVVGGLFTSVEVLKDFKFAELCKYVTITNADVYPFAVVMNQKKWDALPDDVKKIFDDLAAEQAVWTGEYMDNHAKESIEWSKKEQKVEVIELSAEEKAKWDALLASNVDTWLKQAKDAKLPADEILADTKALIEKYSVKPEVK